MITRVRAIICAASLRSRFRSGFNLSGDIKREASNSWSTVQDTYLSTKEVLENHRVVFTIGTSIASVLIAWADISALRFTIKRCDLSGYKEIITCELCSYVDLKYPHLRKQFRRV